MNFEIPPSGTNPPSVDLPTPEATSAKSSAEVSDQSDPLGLASLRLPQDFSAMARTRKIVTTVPVRKPNRREWIRVHPDATMRLRAAVLELKEEGETYLVSGAMQDELQGEWVGKSLSVALNRQGTLFLWPIRLPREDGQLDAWNRSAADAAERAKQGWVRIASNMNLGAYDLFEPMGTLPSPDWPAMTLEQIILLAFKDRIVDRRDHPLLLRLRGQI